jgi:NADPH-dependent F420 reductase
MLRSVAVTIAILGGTGKEGAGLALRWAIAGRAVVIGSRDPERARAKAGELAAAAPGAKIAGAGNGDAAARGDVVVVALPAKGLAATLPPLAPACRDKVVVSTVVALDFAGPRLFTPPTVGSSAEEVQALLPGARVVAGFHHIAAAELVETAHPIDSDLLLCGDDAAAKETVAELGRAMGLRVLDVGRLSNAGPLEGITAVLASINRRYRIRGAGLRITGL